MALLCKLRGHHWGANCTCTRCGAKREHVWVPEPGKCEAVCSLCGQRTSLPHSWQRCRCTVCGAVRNENHKWAKSDGRCRRRCEICGREEQLPHQYRPVEGRCAERCEICGDERELAHHFADGVCTVCGVEEERDCFRRALGTANQAEAMGYVRRIRDPELLGELVRSVRSHAIRLATLHYLHSDAVLATLARNDELDYEVRISARAKIRDSALQAAVEIPVDPVYQANYDMDIRSGM